MLRKLFTISVMLLLLAAPVDAASIINGVTGYTVINGVTTPTVVNGVAQTWTSEHSDTFDIAADADDWMVYGQGAVYSGLSYVSNVNGLFVRRYLQSGIHQVACGLLRWNTASLPDTATITSVTIKLKRNAVAVIDENPGYGLYMDWHNWTPTPGSGDWAKEPTSDAYNGPYTVTNLAAINTEFTFTLLNPNGKINLTGYTGIRILIGSGEPINNNQIEFQSFPSSYFSRMTIVSQY